MKKRLYRLMAMIISATISIADISGPVYAADTIAGEEATLTEETVTADKSILTEDAVLTDVSAKTEEETTVEGEPGEEDILMPDTDASTDGVSDTEEVFTGSIDPIKEGTDELSVSEDTVSTNEVILNADPDGAAASRYISPEAVGKPSRAQGEYWTSWAFSVISAVEMSAAKNGIKLPDATADDPVNLSELHLAYFLGSDMEPYDPLGGFDGDRNGVVKDTFLDWGACSSASDMLTSWIGAAAESKYPYSNASYGYTTDGKNAIDDAVHVSGYYVADPVNYRDEVKQLVKDHGAATISYCSYEDEDPPAIGKQYTYSSTYNSYYLNQVTESNHSALIIGWDDDFPKDNFVQKPEGNGAWLIRDSWREGNTIDASGTLSGDDAEYYSYFWLSYYDNSIRGYSSYAFDVDDTDKYDRNYQYDGAFTSSYRPGPTKYANVFTGKGESSEYIKAVYFATFTSHMNYTIDIYNGAAYGSPTSGEKAATQKGSISYAGGHTIKLDKPVLINKGEKFSVVITVPSTAYMMLEYSQEPYESWIETTAKTVEGRSMYYDGEKWVNSNFGDASAGDYRIKALTEEEEEAPSTVFVTFDAMGGLSPADYKLLEIGREFGSLPEPEREGYTFEGWYTDADGGEQILSSSIVTDPINSTNTLYARWKAEKIRVSLDAGSGGTISPAYLEVSYGGQYTGLADPTAKDSKHVFAGWYTQPEGGSRVTAESPAALVLDHTLYAHWITVNGDDSEISEDDRDDVDINDLENDNFWVRGIPADTPYTGSAIRFDDLRLYKGNKRLALGKDYTLAYQNNINAYTYGEGDEGYKAGKAPMVTIKGKGNYSGQRKVPFKITQIDLTEAAVNGKAFATPVSLEENDKQQKGKTTVYYETNSGKTLVLKEGKDYEYNADSYALVEAAPGSYTVTVRGKGNYKGQLTFTETITAKNAGIYNMSKAAVKSIPAQKATGKEISLSDQDLVVTYKSKTGAVVPEYDIRYVNNILPGTATVILEGKNSFTGVKTATFKINAVKINKAAVSLSDPSGYTYTGAPIYPGVEVTYAEKRGMVPEELKECTLAVPDGDYKLLYTNNINAGKNKANILVEGKNRFTGTYKKAFTINPVNMGNKTDVSVTVLNPVTGNEADKVTIDGAVYAKVPYQKGGSKPAVKAVFHGLDSSGAACDYELVEGRDYTLSVKNNKSVNMDFENMSKAPVLTVKGKGNFTGSINIQFAIDYAQIKVATIMIDDVVYKNKAGNAATKLSITDLNGKKLASGTDYEKNLVFIYKKIPQGAVVRDKKYIEQVVNIGDEVDIKNHIVPAGTIIEAKAKGKGNYKAEEIEAEYRIVKASVASAKIKIRDQVYTGKPISIGYDDIISAKVGKNDIGFEDYVIENCYVNVNKKGKIRIRGRGNYGCVKEVTFSIVNPKF